MKIRVLHVVETIKSGGVENRRYTLARMLDKQLFQQKIACTQTIGPLAENIANEGVEVIPIGKFTTPLQTKGYKKLLAIIKSYKPHIIHGAVFEGVTLAAIAGTIAKVPVIIIEETSDPLNRTWKGNLLLRFFASLANAVVGVSPSVGQYLLNVAKVPARKVKVINNGITFPALPGEEEIASIKAQLGITSDDFVIGSVGRIRDFHKRFSDLIKAVAILKEKGLINIKLVIVGDGADRPILEELSKTLGVAGNVIFTGFKPDTAIYYCIMNVFAIASHMEAFGLVAAEAMYFKLPVVATMVGGLKDIVVDGTTGILVNKDSPAELAAAFEQLYHNRQLITMYGLAGHARAVEEYSAEKYVNNVTALYNSFNRESD